MGALLVASLFLGILNSVFVQPVIGSERQVFYRERAAGMYAVFPWYLGMVSSCPVPCRCAGVVPSVLVSVRSCSWFLGVRSGCALPGRRAVAVVLSIRVPMLETTAAQLLAATA